MRILVTGASGLLGINLALEASKEHSVFGLVNNHVIRSPHFKIVTGDLLVPGTAERVLDDIQPDWVIHCAALANLDACEADPAQARQINSKIPRRLAELVARGGARLLHVSTDAVFDGRRPVGSSGKAVPYTEEDDPNPIGVYTSSKLEAERLVAEVNPQAIIARVNLFGYSLGGQRSLSEFFLYNLQSGKPVKGFTDVYFCPLLANDLGQIFLRMLSVGLSGLYHVVSSECLTKHDFGLRIARLFELDENLIQPSSVKEGGLKASRSPNLNLNSGKLASAMGSPMPSVTEGLEKFHQLYQQGYPTMIREMGVLDLE
jgi:dTDP-4-dehydrorhamnose reductase